MAFSTVVNPKTGAPYPLTVVGAAGVCPIERQSLVSTAAGAVAVNLPTPGATLFDNSILAIVDSTGNAAAHPITVTAVGATIDGAATVTIALNFGAALFQWDNTNAIWHQILVSREIGIGPPVQIVAENSGVFTGALGANPLTTSSYVAIGATPALSGQLRLTNGTPGVSARNVGGTADVSAIYVDNSNYVQIGDGTNSPTAQLNAASIITLLSARFGAVEWGGFSYPGWLQAQCASGSEPTGGSSTFGQLWVDSNSRPKSMDAFGNKSQGAIFVATLNANATTTVVAATATNLAFQLGANDVVYLEVDGLLQCNNTGGVNIGFTLPAGATIAGGFYGATSAATAILFGAINAAGLVGILATQALVQFPFRVSVRVKGGGTAGAVTFTFASQTATQTSTIFAGTTMRVVQATSV